MLPKIKTVGKLQYSIVLGMLPLFRQAMNTMSKGALTLASAVAVAVADASPVLDAVHPAARQLGFMSHVSRGLACSCSPSWHELARPVASASYRTGRRRRFACASVVRVCTLQRVLMRGAHSHPPATFPCTLAIAAATAVAIACSS